MSETNKEEDWIKEFDEKFPFPQREPTHYIDDSRFEDCKCLACNPSKYHSEIKSFITSLRAKDREDYQTRIVEACCKSCKEMLLSTDEKQRIQK